MGEVTANMGMMLDGFTKDGHPFKVFVTWDKWRPTPGEIIDHWAEAKWCLFDGEPKPVNFDDPGVPDAR